MSRKLALFLALMLSGVSIGSLPQPANAQTPLTRAVIQALRNRVRLMQKNQPVRSARVSDAMTPGDALSTARASLAELRFNDGSLARVGEQAVFRFIPNARTFQLSNGTMLLLIPPGRGPTGIRTPNAAAGIKGSALFVRYIPESDTTLVGALTNNPLGPMVIYNRDGSQSQGLRAGQLAVVVKNRIENVYDFDLNTFYETSDLVKGLNLTQKDSASPSDEAIAAVRAETVEALETQSPFQAANVIENPAFVRLPAATADFPVNNLDRVFNSLDVRRVVEAGEAQSGQTVASPQQTGAGSGSVPPVTGATPTTTQPLEPATSTQNPTPGTKPAISPPPEPTPVTSTSRPSDPLGQRPEKAAPTDPRLLTPRPLEPADPGSQPNTSTPPATPTPPITGGPAPDQGPSTPPSIEVEVGGDISLPAEPPVLPEIPTTLPNPTPPVGSGPDLPTQTPGSPSDVGQPGGDPGTGPSPDPTSGNPQPDPEIINPPVLIEPVTGPTPLPIDPTSPVNPPTPPGQNNPPAGGDFPGGGATGGEFPGGANGGNFPGQGPATDPTPTPNSPGGGQPTAPANPTGNTPPNGGTTNSNFPGGGATNGQFPGGGATNGQFPGRAPINK